MSPSPCARICNRLHRVITARTPMANNKLAILVGGGPAPGINSVIAAATIRAKLAGHRRHRRPRRLRVAHAGGYRSRDPAVDRGGQPHPFPRRVVSRHRAREPDEGSAAAREHRQRAAAAERVAAHHDRRRRHGVFRDEARAARRRPLSASCTCRRRSTTTSICRRTSTRSASSRRVTTASTSSRT